MDCSMLSPGTPQSCMPHRAHGPERHLLPHSWLWSVGPARSEGGVGHAGGVLQNGGWLSGCLLQVSLWPWVSTCQPHSSQRPGPVGGTNLDPAPSSTGAPLNPVDPVGSVNPV